MTSRIEGRCPGLSESNRIMSHSTNKPISKLRNAPQPPLSHAGAIPDTDRQSMDFLPANQEPIKVCTFEHKGPGCPGRILENFRIGVSSVATRHSAVWGLLVVDHSDSASALFPHIRLDAIECTDLQDDQF